MRVRRSRYIDHFRAGVFDRLVEIGKCLRNPAALGAPTSALGIRTYEAHDVEARGSQCGNVDATAEPRPGNQRGWLGYISHDGGSVRPP